ncbi:MAG: hypothetical protein U5K69_16185 [Balneolaceae bacterium]|nr:hypothetical protein [Balneolaceae bacterium]
MSNETESAVAQTSSASVSEDIGRYTTPLILHRADPWVYLHSDGYYYFTATVPEYDRLEVRRAKTIEGLKR